MNIRECHWCGKAIYGDNYYVGTGGYYHRDCQIPDGSDCLTTMGGTGGIGGYREVASLPEDFLFSDGQLLKQELARLKELNREMVEALKELVYLNNSISKGKTYAPIDKDERVEIWNRVAELLAKAEEGEG